MKFTVAGMSKTKSIIITVFFALSCILSAGLSLADDFDPFESGADLQKAKTAFQKAKDEYDSIENVGDEIVRRSQLSAYINALREHLKGRGLVFDDKGNVAATPDKNVIKAGGDTKIKGQIDDTEADWKPPKDYIPWKVASWPKDSRRMHDKEFMTRVRILDDRRTDWSRKFRRDIQTMTQSQLKTHFTKISKKMILANDPSYASWKALVKARPKVRTDLKRYMNYWVRDKKLTTKIVAEVLDPHMGKQISKAVGWYWLDAYLRKTHVQRDYETAQKDVRRLLLIKKKWDQQSAAGWDGEMDLLRNKIVFAERKMLWLLGYSSRPDLKDLAKLEQSKLKDLTSAQKELYEAFIALQYWTTQRDWLIGYKAGTSEQAALKGAQDNMDKWEREFHIRTGKLDQVRAKFSSDNLKRDIMKAGILKSLNMAFLNPHKIDDGDQFYREIMGGEEYEKLRKQDQFKTFKSLDVYLEFLPPKSEKSNLRKQEANRRKAVRR